MSFIKDYSVTLIGAALFSGVISVLAPSGDKGKVLRFIAGAALLLCIAAPVINGVSNLSDRIHFDFERDYYDESFAEDYTGKVMENEIKSRLNACVKEIAGDGAKEINLEVKYENEKYTIENAVVVLPYAQKDKCSAVESVINHRFGVKPKVITESEAEYNG